MSSTTLILIVKSLWPFLKEILLKDKGLRELLVQNVIATFLSGCLLILFGLFMYTANLADKNFNEARGLKQELANRDETIAQLRKQLPSTSGSGAPRDPPSAEGLLNSGPQKLPDVPMTIDQQEPLPSHPPKPNKPSTRPTKTDQPQKGSENLKSYVESRLKKFEQDGN